MLIPKQKIQVFISSACGEGPDRQKYNYVREALKVLIDSTGFAEAYVFESSGASTVSAGHHFTFALEDCDVCVFIIDNKDGVPLGVQKEIDIAKKHGIKSIFYFCDEFEKDETPLQKSLKGSQYAKSETISDFKDIINLGANDLINDLVMVYKHYCKGRLTWHEEPLIEQTTNVSSLELSSYLDSVARKDILTNIDCCVNYFTKLIFEYSEDEVKKTGTIDKSCAAFLPVIFEGEPINEENLNSLLAEIKKHQSSNHFAVTEKRYEAIREYYLGNQEACIKKLEEALQIAKQNSISDWLIKDILIDLRNQDMILQECRNSFSPYSKYQNELDNSQYLLYYPLLDRLDSNFYEGIIQQTIKYRTQSPGTINFGHGLGEYIKSLSGIFVVAMYNGSLSHLQLLFKRLKLICFYCAVRYSDWNTKKLLLKTTIIEGRQKETDGIVRYFGDLLSKINEKDAFDIYCFANNSAISHRNFIAKLEAFRITNYYMDDDKFEIAWRELHALICQWIKDENSSVLIGGHIFSTLEGCYFRISQDHLIEIICNCMHNNKRRFYDDIFSLIRKCVNLDQASPANAAKLLKCIINIVRNSDERTHINSLNTALIAIRKKYRNKTEELDSVIAEELPDFYTSYYLLETSLEENKDMPGFLKSYIAQIRKDNEEQGKNGTFYGLNIQPHITIKNILQQSKAEFSDVLLDSAFRATCETLLKESQTIEAKMDAIELLVYLLRSQPDIQDRNKREIGELLSSKSKLETANSFLTNLSETNLKFSALLLYSCLGERIIVGVLETLAYIHDDAMSNRKASAAFLNYLEASNSSVSDIQLEHIIVQQAIEWSVDSDLNTRWNAVQILFSLLRNKDNKNVVCNQLIKLMDTDSVQIKSKILRNIYLLKDIDNSTFNYIIQKATIDTNYVVRKVVKELQLELGLQD